jgi:hypothetical protein
MRLAAWIAVAAVAAACTNPVARFLRSYEYEEELYLSLDGTATLYVNSSLAALNRLRGTAFDENPDTRVDRAAITAHFTSSVTRVTRVTESRRNNRRYVHVRMNVADVRQLGRAAPFAWSVYDFTREGETMRFRQNVGGAHAPAAPEEARAGWDGPELVAFRVHIPSQVRFHNAGEDNLRRGNILVWEQPLADRLRGTPLVAEVRMDTTSTLSRTLLLFGATALAVALMFAGIVWRLTRRPT